jgi:hypothetical protein
MLLLSKNIGFTLVAAVLLTFSSSNPSSQAMNADIKRRKNI